MRTHSVVGGIRPNTRNAILGIISLLAALSVILALVTGSGDNANAAKSRVQVIQPAAEGSSGTSAQGNDGSAERAIAERSSSELTEGDEVTADRAAADGSELAEGSAADADSDQAAEDSSELAQSNEVTADRAAAGAKKARPCEGHGYKRYNPRRTFQWQKTSPWFWATRNSRPGDAYVQFRSGGGEYVYKQLTNCSIVRGWMAGAASYRTNQCGDMRSCQPSAWQTITEKGSCSRVYNKIRAYDPTHHKCFTY
ncbi:hypothetical protein AB0B57_11705 [Micromonospora sp. NPDC049101]|uniref:hypothetical protein n=1 Tax=Micromonospora sp. NPDC049101 TaxID=3155032 RepID=UPI0033E66534